MLGIVISVVTSAVVIIGLNMLLRLLLWEDRFQEDGPDKIVDLD